ncbi:MAG: DNA polymerase beta superfamily protein [Candidatus Thorarchaeota archaeon]|jgi:predicted nucleotidyltransferase
MTKNIFKHIIPWGDAEVILSGLRGSHAHGTNLPPENVRATDDIDYFAVLNHGPAFYIGLHGYWKTQEDYERKVEEVDLKAYNIRKFAHLILKGNPNVHNWLWADPGSILYCKDAGRMFIETREHFLSRRVLKATAGYADQQIKKMSTLQEYKGYMGEKRKKNVDDFGYDVKNAAHCIRLLWMGTHLANEGELVVKLPPDFAEEIRSLKRGEWSIMDVKLRASAMWDEFRAAERNSSLPENPDEELMHDILYKAINTHSSVENRNGL